MNTESPRPPGEKDRRNRINARTLKDEWEGGRLKRQGDDKKTEKGNGRVEVKVQLKRLRKWGIKRRKRPL